MQVILYGRDTKEMYFVMPFKSNPAAALSPRLTERVLGYPFPLLSWFSSVAALWPVA